MRDQEDLVRRHENHLRYMMQGKKWTLAERVIEENSVVSIIDGESLIRIIESSWDGIKRARHIHTFTDGTSSAA